MQTRLQTRAEKKRADHVGWVALPLDIIEKIVAYAVKGDKKEGEPEYNWYAERVVNYGSVCPAWKRAIILSRTIFQRDKSLSPQTLCPKRLVILHGSGILATHFTHSSMVATKFIEEGYLPAVKRLDLQLFRSALPMQCTLPMSKIVKSIAENNSIEWCRLTIESSRDLNLTKTREIKALLKRLTKADDFDIDIWIDSQKQARCLWDVMRSVVHSNSRPKTIKFSCNSWRDLDWGFINETERLNVGSIAHLTINAAPMPVEIFNKLADIGTLVENRYSFDDF